MSYHVYAEDVECRSYHQLPNLTDLCAFINATSDCAMEDGFINYLSFLFCSMPKSLEILSLIIMFIWWLLLFIALATTADKFFCPSLAVISKTLRMSENLAGVTFLAFGNGSPDIFSSISAVGSIKGGDVGLAFGALLGAGIYVTTVVAGAIAFAKPFKAMERPLLKDIIFYLAAVYWTFLILYKQEIYLGEAIGFIALYILYVIITLIARAVYQRQRRDGGGDLRQLVSNLGNTTQGPRGRDHSLDTMRAIIPPDRESIVGSVRSRGSSRSSLSHKGIMAPNYMVRWAVARDVADFFGDHRSRSSSRPSTHRPSNPPKRTQSMSEVNIVGLVAETRDNNLLSVNVDSRRRTVSDVGPSRISTSLQDRSAVAFQNFAYDDDEGVYDHVGDLPTNAVRERRMPHLRTAYSVDYTSTGTPINGDLINHLSGADINEGYNDTSDVLPQADVEKRDDEEGVEEEPRSALKEFLYDLAPLDLDNWSEFSLLSKIYEVVKMPVLFLLLIVTPVVDCDLPKQGWNKYKIMLNTFLAPNFCFLVTRVSMMSVGGVVPAGVIILAGSFVFPIIIFFTSKREKEPIYLPLFAFVGFITSILWIYCIANEIVNILNTWGIYFNISNAILGLTFLAWGNSVGDTISNVVMAREGYPRMAISACFGGPLFNILLGIGIPFTLKTAQTGVFPVNRTGIEYILIGALTISLISSIIYLPVRRFRIGKVYGSYLFLLYIAFLIVALLTETKVINITI